MSKHNPISFRHRFVNNAVSKTVLIYAGFASLWILLSDQAILLITSDPERIALISTAKGWLFVAATSLLLSIMIRRYLNQLAMSEERWKFALEGAGDGVWDWHFQTGTAMFSKRWKSILGYAEHEIGPSSDEWAKRVHPDDMPIVKANLDAHIEGKTPSTSTEFRMRCKDGGWKWILGRGMVVSRDDAGKPIRLVGTTTDITKSKFLEAELKRQAHIDHLTGVDNRGHFMAQAELELSRAARFGKSPSLLMLDIDWFKQVNDTYGHVAGDQVLKKLAEVCLHTLRDVDTIGRLGGEEFAILLPETNKEEAAEVAERLRVAVGDASVPLKEGQAVQITVSIGVASVDMDNCDIDALLSKADQAMYEAKQLGRNRVCVAER